MPNISYADKLLPHQDYFSHLYCGSSSYMEALYELTSAFARDFSAARFDLVTPEKVAFEEMSTPPAQLALFNAIIQLTQARNVLEIGTFIGHSAMQFACMLGSAGNVTTLEVGKEFADISRETFRRNGFDPRITILEGDAGAILDGLPRRRFDLIFIDGRTQDYLDYALKSEDLQIGRAS